ncbi:MAG TPA: D-glycerate dehydrogenase [Halanaerobiales bacterium]|nr:D-glycerate dehydrogenase [Halanaerobiales bacterium]
MSKPLIYITSEIPEKGLEILKKEFKIKSNNSGKSLSKNELISEAKKADAILPLLSDEIDSKVMDELENLKVIANYAVGYNNIDVKAATKRNIIVTNTPDVLTETTADLTWGLLLAVARRIVETDKILRNGKFEGWAPKLLLGNEVNHKTLGIIGLGRIGKAVAKRAQGFNMKVLYNKRNRLDEKKEESLNVEYREFEKILKEADYISINTPLNESTYHLFSTKEFSLMKDDSILINTGRGPIINEKELVKALKNKEIGGAGLDVYENEPEVEEGLLKFENVVLTPHIGSATYRARNKMAELAAKGAIAGYKRENVPNIVNKELLK